MHLADRKFCLILLAAVVLRLGLLLTSQGGANCDESVVGLMGMHVMQGRAMPVYVYGFRYNGGAAITAYLVAPVFRMAGVSSFNLKLVPMLFSLAFLIFTYLFCRRFLGARVGLIAGVLLLLEPGYLQWNLNACGGQVIMLLLSMLLLHIFYRMYFEGRSTPRWHLLFGLVAGVGYWNFTYILVLASGLLLLLILAEGKRFLIRALPLVGLGAVLGLLPIVLDALFRSAATSPDLVLVQLARPSAIPANVWAIVTRRLPALFSPWCGHNIVFPYCWILLVVTAACLAHIAWDQRAGFIKMAHALVAIGRCAPQREHRAARVWPLLLYVPAYVTVAALNRIGYAEARYLLPIHPAVTILTAAALARLLSGNRWRRLLGWAGIGLVVVIGLAVHVDFLLREGATNEDKFRSRVDGRVRVLQVKNAGLRQLIAFLDRKRIRSVYAPMELRSRIVFETHERILASNRYLLARGTYLTPQRDYYPAHTAILQRRLERGEPYAIVFRQDMRFCVGANKNPELYHLWHDLLREWKRKGGSYRVARIGGFVVYYDFKRGAESGGREKRAGEGRMETENTTRMQAE